MADDPRRYTLIAADGKPYSSPQKGTVGGHRGSRIFGRLDCPAALRAIARGGYVKHRVFFANPVDALRAGYRPCAVCIPPRSVGLSPPPRTGMTNEQKWAEQGSNPRPSRCKRERLFVNREVARAEFRRSGSLPLSVD